MQRLIKNKTKTFLLLVLFSMLFAPTRVFAQVSTNPFGTVTNPLPGGSLGPGGGLTVLLNNVLRLIFLAAGIFSFLKVVQSGLKFIAAGGDVKKIEQAWAAIWQALLGMTIVVSSIAVAALLGLLFFGNASAILNPKIYGP